MNRDTLTLSEMETDGVRSTGLCGVAEVKERVGGAASVTLGVGGADGSCSLQ